ncbi:MAG: NERD domain-containing protein [Alphaproteobacteria bacterium]|nr:NERD domain-containing protein [Alphaproteobacteria bacterium]
MEIIIIIFFVVLFILVILGHSHNKQHEFVFINRKTRSKDCELLETVTSLERGTWAERDLVLDLLKNDIPAGAVFHDLYIKKPNGSFSQIDLVVATKVGLIVIEVKDYGGWIFGNGHNSQWTQGMRRGQKFRFYNPIMQNKRHIEELQKQSKQFKNLPFYSVIVFHGSCELKDISFVPKGTFVTSACRFLDVINLIINENEDANYTDKREVIRILKNAVENGNIPNIQEQHAEKVQDMLGKERVFA